MEEEAMKVRRAKYYGPNMALGDVYSLFRALGVNWSELKKRADALTAKKARHLIKQVGELEKRIEEIRNEIEFEEIWSKLFEETGKLKHFATVKHLARREKVSTTSVRRWIARGKLRSVKGLRGTFIDVRNMPADRQGAA